MASRSEQSAHVLHESIGHDAVLGSEIGYAATWFAVENIFGAYSEKEIRIELPRPTALDFLHRRGRHMVTHRRQTRILRRNEAGTGPSRLPWWDKPSWGRTHSGVELPPLRAYAP